MAESPKMRGQNGKSWSTSICQVSFLIIFFLGVEKNRHQDLCIEICAFKGLIWYCINHPFEPIWVVVSNIFLFSSLFGEMIQFDEHIFQMGWFNHQLAIIAVFCWFRTLLTVPHRADTLAFGIILSEDVMAFGGVLHPKSIGPLGFSSILRNWLDTWRVGG